jgi:hypothetical protein
MLSSDALIVASLAAMLSSAAQTSMISMNLFLGFLTMKMPRRGTVRRKPSCSSERHRLADRLADRRRRAHGSADVHRDEFPIGGHRCSHP